MLCLLVYYWKSGEKGHEYTWLSEVTEATLLGPGFRTHRHVGAWLVSYWCPFWDFGRDLFPSSTAKTTCAWIPMPGKVPVRHPCASRPGLPQLLSQPMCPTYHQIPLRQLKHAESHVKFQPWFLQGQTFQLWHCTLPEAMKSVRIFSCLPGEADLSFGWSVQLWSYCSFSPGAGTVLWVASALSQNFMF